jgi:hypothetical protein
VLRPPLPVLAQSHAARDPLPGAHLPARPGSAAVYPQMRRLLALAASCALLAAAAAGEGAEKGNKFRQREASDDLLAYPHL